MQNRTCKNDSFWFVFCFFKDKKNSTFKIFIVSNEKKTDFFLFSLKRLIEKSCIWEGDRELRKYIPCSNTKRKCIQTNDILQ